MVRGYFSTYRSPERHYYELVELLFKDSGEGRWLRLDIETLAGASSTIGVTGERMMQLYS